MLQDVRFAFRTLLKDRGFTVTAVLTLAVCIAANTATFAIVNAVLLRPLPVPDSQDIVLMSNRYPKAGAGDSTYSAGGDYFDRLTGVTALQDQAMFRPNRPALDVRGTPEQIVSMEATPSLFTLLRVAPVLGRTFTAEEGETGHELKVILSYGLWQRLFGGDRNAIGRQIRLNGRTHEVVGVMPPDFLFFDPDVRLWTPIAFTPEQKTAHHSNNWMNIGRLKPGATVSQVQAQVSAVNAANNEKFPEFKELLINAGFHTAVERLQDVLVRDVRSTLYLLWGGAGFLLLIGALNIANLAFARLNLRRKEFATRIAIGAGRVHLSRQLMVENAMLGLAGGALGTMMGAVLLPALTVLGLDRIPRANEVRIDATVAIFSMGIAVIAAVLTSFVPLTSVFRSSLNEELRQGGRSGSVGTRAFVRQVLVAAQVAIAFALLAGAGLLLTSFRHVLRVNPGFRTDGVMTASISAPRSRYAGDVEVRSLEERVSAAIRQVPGVASAGATTAIPFGVNQSASVIFAEGYVMNPGESVISPRSITVTPGYFETMGIPLVRGRYFNDQDNERSAPAIVVDEILAKKFWPNADPLGRRMYQPQDPKDILKTDEHTRWLRVVGVVRPISQDALDSKTESVGTYYFAQRQSPERFLTFAIKLSSDAESVTRAIRSTIASIDPEMVVFDVKSMSQRAEMSLSSRRAAMALAIAFGGLALFLAAIGTYGVLAYLVTQRRREIGIRVALGSTSGGIVRLVFREGLLLVGIGLVLGIAAAVGLRRALASELYGVSALDPAVLAGVVALLASAALVACIVPARRATKVDPVVVLNES
jgi:predicted permease